MKENPLDKHHTADFATMRERSERFYDTYETHKTPGLYNAQADKAGDYESFLGPWPTPDHANAASQDSGSDDLAALIRGLLDPLRTPPKDDPIQRRKVRKDPFLDKEVRLKKANARIKSLELAIVGRLVGDALVWGGRRWAGMPPKGTPVWRTPHPWRNAAKIAVVSIAQARIAAMVTDAIHQDI